MAHKSSPLRESTTATINTIRDVMNVMLVTLSGWPREAKICERQVIYIKHDTGGLMIGI